MYIENVPNRNSPPAILLREGRRQGKKIRKRTLANISDWAPEKIEAFRRLLRDEPLVSPGDLITTGETLPHGHVEAILSTIRKLGLDGIISAKRCRQRDLVVAMIAQRLIKPYSKLGTTRAWHNTTLAQELVVEDADEDDLYAAMDWLLARQNRIEKKLAKPHLVDGTSVLYDVTGSYYEGRKCPLARFGHNRDGKNGSPIIVYGLLTDVRGCPVAVEVYPGSTGDPTTVEDQMKKLRQQFHLDRVVLVGDRGMLTQRQIEKLKTAPGTGWITALNSVAIRGLAEQGILQMSLFDESNLAEILSPDFPGERLMACYNPLLGQDRRRKRAELLDSTDKALGKIAKEAARRRKKLMTDAEIGIKIGKALEHYKMGKRYNYSISNCGLQWTRNQDSIEKESLLDGIYVIRTSEPKERLSSADAVRTYKRLSQVERAFRCLKGMFDLLVRPIRHRTETRVPAHIFLCMLALYVEWHMRKALAPILFEDEELAKSWQDRDPVLQPKPSQSAKKKKSTHLTGEGLPVQSFESLIEHLATRGRVTYKFKSDEFPVTFTQLAEPTPIQAKAYELLKAFPVTGK